MGYVYAGAKAMVELHQIEMEQFLEVWKQAQDSNLALPKTEDKDYASLEALLRHVLGAARFYVIWSCKNLELPDPGFDELPEEGSSFEDYRSSLAQILDRWGLPFKEVPEEAYYKQTYKTGWGTDHTIETMLEHAVVHPMRHRHQLSKLMERR
ncbi:MAG: hypothetical protein HKN21_04835 [Candidatus Eisenbacteria bacterium]|uniref:DinB family protein n=1 Tax=Eiseniibacteriota bacterium TaxID=2212470 RepID=A0A7Y2H1H9_UNCEI|nr:hypothetical protein [Candidatus Eisenbacteria bacterium]